MADNTEHPVPDILKWLQRAAHTAGCTALILMLIVSETFFFLLSLVLDLADYLTKKLGEK